MEKKLTQNQMIAMYMLKGRGITPLEALNKFGCFRLGARIADLKKLGLEIDSNMVRDKVTGKRYARYTLAEGCDVDLKLLGVA